VTGAPALPVLAALACAAGVAAHAAPPARPARVQATITWTPVPGAAGYELEIARDPAFEDVVHRASPVRPRYLWSTTEGVVSYLRVRAGGVGGRKSPWSPARVIELRLVAPEPLAPEPGATHLVASGPLELEAAPSRYATEFRFQLSRDDAFQEVSIDLRSKTGRVEVAPVALGDWYWRVGGEDGYGNQLPFSQPRALTLLAAAPRPVAPAPPPVRAAPSVLALPPPEAPPPPAAEPVAAPRKSPEVKSGRIATFGVLVGVGWRGASGRGGIATAAAVDAWPTVFGGRLGLRLHLDTWSTALNAPVPGGARPSFQAWSAQGGVVGRITAGALQLSAGLTAGALRGAASSAGASAGATALTGRLFADAAVPLGIGRLGLELSLPEGRWRAGGMDVRLGSPAALLTWSDELP
jgi:hypothetical protein